MSGTYLDSCRKDINMRPLAEQGDPMAQFQLGLDYADAVGVQVPVGLTRSKLNRFGTPFVKK